METNNRQYKKYRFITSDFRVFPSVILVDEDLSPLLASSLRRRPRRRPPRRHDPPPAEDQRGLRRRQRGRSQVRVVDEVVSRGQPVQAPQAGGGAGHEDVRLLKALH